MLKWAGRVTLMR